MECTTVREAFDWLKWNRRGISDRNIWHAILAWMFEHKGADLGSGAVSSRVERSLLTCAFTLASSGTDDAVQHFTDYEASETLGIAIAFIRDLGANMVIPTN